MPILNPSFEDEGALPGEAAHWTLSAVTNLEEIAGFGTLPEQAWDGFERWFALLATLEDVVSVRAFFGVALEGHEAFEAGWGAGPFLGELSPAQVVVAEFGQGAIEDMEAGWSNDGFLWSWDNVSSTVAQFDGEPREDFEDQWAGNQGFDWGWSSVVSSAARFDDGTATREGFDSDWPPATSQ